MSAESIDRLLERERVCLRLVLRSYSTKEIAREIGTTDLRAQKIIESAMHKLGVSRRVEAARLLAAHEHRGVGVPPGEPATLADANRAAPHSPQDERVGQPLILRDERTLFGVPRDPEEFGLPLRRRGGRHNDLTVWKRALWMAVLCAVAVLGIGVLARSLSSFSERIVIVPANAGR